MASPWVSDRKALGVLGPHHECSQGVYRQGACCKAAGCRQGWGEGIRSSMVAVRSLNLDQRVGEGVGDRRRWELMLILSGDVLVEFFKAVSAYGLTPCRAVIIG
jgi:hypothetical protein